MAAVKKVKQGIDDSGIMYGITDVQAKELTQQYNELEKVVETMKRVLKQINAFDTIIYPYVRIYNVLAPPNTIIESEIGRFNARIFFNSFGYIIFFFIILFVVFPAISGFIKLPWGEVVPLTIAIVCMTLMFSLKKQLGLVSA